MAKNDMKKAGNGQIRGVGGFSDNKRYPDMAFPHHAVIWKDGKPYPARARRIANVYAIDDSRSHASMEWYRRHGPVKKGQL